MHSFLSWLNETSEPVTVTKRYRTKNLNALKGHVKEYSENGLKVSIKAGDTHHEVTATGPKHLVSRIHNVLDGGFNKHKTEAERIQFEKKGVERLSEEVLTESVKDILQKHVAKLGASKDPIETHKKEEPNLLKKLSKHSDDMVMHGARDYCSIHNPKGDSFAHGIIDSHLSGEYKVKNVHAFASELALRSGMKASRG